MTSPSEHDLASLGIDMACVVEAWKAVGAHHPDWYAIMPGGEVVVNLRRNPCSGTVNAFVYREGSLVHHFGLGRV